MYRENHSVKNQTHGKAAVGGPECRGPTRPAGIAKKSVTLRYTYVVVGAGPFPPPKPAGALLA